ncbi:head GIN domain-containing protein [Flavobacterium sp. LHD-80]|uniref:head GIN domain-containing protein n=1 Tax=Flavobacterium sp. LHD-80 TaxID=3071411 RepID=UPI0027E038CA|nr:head GIN domain-containing protein [Flavobacterium sp. LHD-80]MDQ6472989.1 head GIN domain-containing protein [Flavobacterium sp. LHD-80]
MKKIIQSVVCAAFLIGLTASAQEKINGNGNVVTETRTTSEYDAIKISGFFDVDLVAGKEGKITIKGEQNIVSAIIVEVQDNALKIYTKKGTNLRPSTGKKVEITVPFEKISELSLSGSGDIVTKSPIKNDKFSAKLSGSGDIDLDVAANTFDFSLSGSGDIKLKGNSDNLTIKLSGSGDIEAANLKSKNANISVSGSGDVKVNCNESITARVSGSGDIKYTGNPEKRDVKVSGSGSISKA